MPYPEFDRSQLRIRPLSERKNRVLLADVRELDAPVPRSHDPELEAVAAHVVAARRAGREVVLMMGAHPLRRGNSRYLIDLMARRLLTHVATNGAVAIHDYEMALVGGTSEHVAETLADGSFGNWRETCQGINEAVSRGVAEGLGFGEAVGRAILDDVGAVFPNKDVSLFASAVRLGVPITVHKGIGYDITDQHPAADYAAIGAATGRDFLIFANTITRIAQGVLINMGSQVMGPEVFLKALSMARNVASQRGETIAGFTTANFDLKRYDDPHDEGGEKDVHYYDRVKKTILGRTVRLGGSSHHVCGDFAVSVPAFHHRLIELDEKDHTP
ncbi:MAG: hypothetical protein JW889_14005 [Verrucomicrobia bacterium]|nr:hypothetical protein [Verrucomicrobiota bacterium]